ncbi:MAG: HEAT repeat domain-containing protein [Anaerolineae bacterium]|nr:MAG: HEAT repeat domain-containing protein [Anaerolineae bacterium]
MVRTEADIDVDDQVMVKCYIEALYSNDREIRETTMQVLTQIGNPAIPSLVKSLQAPNCEVRQCAAGVLEQLKWVPASDIEYGFYAFASQRWDLLVEIGLAALYAIAAALQDESFYIRTSAVLALGEMAHPESLPLLELAIQDENPYVRSAAARALGHLGEPSLDHLRQALHDEDKGVRMEAANALVKMREAAVPVLINALREGDWYLRGEIAQALVDIGSKVVPSLVDLLKDNELCYDAADILTALKVDPRQYGFQSYA